MKNHNNNSYLSVLEKAKDYFIKSEERYIACLLLLGVVFSVIGLVVLSSLFATWMVGFWAALTANNVALFISSMKVFGVITTCYICTTVAKDYMMDWLGIRWRNWLTKNLLARYTSGDKNFLDLKRLSPEIDNPQQRIQEDIQSFVDMTLSLSTNLLNAVLKLGTFIGTLWIVGGAFSFTLLGASITIPGYLVWVALGFALVATGVTHWIGSPLANIAKEKRVLEADFRKQLEWMHQEAESIALEKGERYYKQLLANQTAEIRRNDYQKLNVNSRLNAFKSFYQQTASIFPYIAAAPLYFSGITSLGQLMEIGFAFSEVQTSLSWFIDSYETLADFDASVARIRELEHALEYGSTVAAKQSILINQLEPQAALSVGQLNIALPKTMDSSSKFIMRGLNLTFKSGEHVLIKGRSGFGKSTLFKVMAGTWKYGDGEVCVSSHRQSMFFLPQKPSIPKDTLRAILSYPDPSDTYSDDEYEAVLRDVSDMDPLIAILNDPEQKNMKQDLSSLSGGQQQRIAFARALLRKPEWLFLDETTSALDVPAESYLYGLLKSKLPQSTLISIAHRPTVVRFHDRQISFIGVDTEGKIQITDRRVSTLNSDLAANDQTLDDFEEASSASSSVCSN